MRVVSTVVGYMLVMMVSVAVDVALLSIYLSHFSRDATAASALAGVATGGLVYGVYTVAPCTITMGGLPTYIEATCAYVSILNPNPIPVEVVLLAHFPGSGYFYSIANLLSPQIGGVFWDTPDGNPPPGVSITRATGWFAGPVSPPGGSDAALRIDAGGFASFRVPLHQSGAPSKVLACTRVGCTRLHTVGVQLLMRLTGTGWLIDPRGERTIAEEANANGESVVPTIPVTQYWEWEAMTLAGPKGLCRTIIHPWTMTLLFSQTLRKGGAMCCESPCPSDCPFCTVAWLWERGFCNEVNGVMTPATQLVGYPPNILLAYVTDDPSFSFVVKRRPVIVGSGGYIVYGFDSTSYPQLAQSYSHLISEWKRYDGWTCNERHVVVRARFFADPSGTSPLSSIYPHVRRLYVYAALKGPVTNSAVEEHSVELVIKEVRLDRKERIVAVLRADSQAFVDNNGNIPYIDASKVVEIVVEARYVMRMKPPPIGCYASILGVPIYCGSNSGDLRVRLAFYVELISEHSIA